MGLPEEEIVEPADEQNGDGLEGENNGHVWRMHYANNYFT